MANANRNRRGAARRAVAPAKPSWPERIKRGVTQAVVVVGVVAVLAGAAQGGLYLLDLRIERIAVTGSTIQVDLADIESMIASRVGAGFLATDLDAIRVRLEALPWVYSANVRRRWPDSVAIHIEEQRPIARWGVAGFLNHEGDYFPGEDGQQWQRLPRLEGPAGSEVSMMRRYQNLEALLSDTGLEVVWLAEDDVGQVSAELDNGMVLALGSDHFVRRVRRFVTLYRQHLVDQAVVRVDLRYEHGAAVQLLEPQFADNGQLKEEAL